MKRRWYQPIGFALVMIVGVSCHQQPKLPAKYTTVQEEIRIYPDYKNITIPPNIAPLNFIIRSDAKQYLVEVKSSDTTWITAADKKGAIQFDETTWKRILQTHRGKTLQVKIYAQTTQGWLSYPAHMLEIAQEEIDPYLSYRLIEPGYSYYRQLGIYQRDLTTFEETPIYENNRTFDYEENHCVNCHNYQNYSTRKMMFHVRTNHSGTVIIRDGKVDKINFTHDTLPGGAVYPTWHPQQDLIVFSSNKTGQAFHIQNKEKVEVIDQASDLIMYDIDKKKIQYIFKTDSLLETFPCWSPAGNKLYYCVADLKKNTHHNYQELYYDIMSIPFDPKTKQFGEPKMEVNCTQNKQSASVPRISPDGRYLLFTVGSYGQFHIWHKNADLYIKDLQTDSIYPLSNANSKDAESYHTWSSNGKWIVFSSRRDDGSYTRLYISYFNPTNKKSHKAFLIPQKEPDKNLLQLKSYNVPELTKDKCYLLVSPP